MTATFFEAREFELQFQSEKKRNGKKNFNDQIEKDYNKNDIIAQRLDRRQSSSTDAI
ncbi:hypothetical protein T06_6764 [Trichinella sp. T6]|nr:hypothetical protein T06_6764 [Trichinella sp. T6]